MPTTTNSYFDDDALPYPSIPGEDDVYQRKTVERWEGPTLDAIKAEIATLQNADVGSVVSWTTTSSRVGTDGTSEVGSGMTVTSDSAADPITIQVTAPGTAYAVGDILTLTATNSSTNVITELTAKYTLVASDFQYVSIVVIELGDTVITDELFQKSLEGEDRFVFKMTESADDLLKVFGMADGDQREIYQMVAAAFDPTTPDAEKVKKCSEIGVVYNRDSKSVAPARVFATALSVPLSAIDDDSMNLAFAKFVLPSLFDGKVFNVASLNSSTSTLSHVTKDSHIKNALVRLGLLERVVDTDGVVSYEDFKTSTTNASFDGHLTRLVFKATLKTASRSLTSTKVGLADDEQTSQLNTNTITQETQNLSTGILLDFGNFTQQ